MRSLLTLFLFVAGPNLFGQDSDFVFGSVTIPELSMTRFEMDTSAAAVVLKEHGYARLSNDPPYNLIFEHHIRTKILRTDALDRGNVSIVLRRFSSQQVEYLREIQASSFRLTTAGIEEAKLEKPHMFTERHPDYEVVKLAIPNVQIGSVVEIRYILETPDYFNFKRWDFQEEIPKVTSTYVALIPANYIYKISLKGVLPLVRNDSEVVRECFIPVGGNKASCTRLVFSMDSIPAFAPEEFMTSPRNFRSSVNFELSEIKHFTGGVSKITKEWRNVEEELRTHPSFGTQLKRGKELFDESNMAATLGMSDTLRMAKFIHRLIGQRIEWDGTDDKYSENGVRAAWEKRRGNSADINLAMIAAFRYAGIKADPIILSTRENGFVTELYPVLSEFNYVLASVHIGGRTYLVDGTDRLMPFGMIPLRCFNGRGRRIGTKRGDWTEIRPADKFREQTFLSVVLDSTGHTVGEVQYIQIGYDAVDGRKAHQSDAPGDEYVSMLAHAMGMEVESYTLQNLDSLDKPLIENIRFKIKTDGDREWSLNPYVFGRWEVNPFKSVHRTFPVDFPAPIEERLTLQLQYPSNYELLQSPKPLAVFLPRNGGKFVVESQETAGRLTISSWLSIDQALFTPEQYAGLREWFARVVESQATEIILRRK